MAYWTPYVFDTETGAFALVVSAPGRRTIEVTYYRDTPVVINSYSYGDPFGDATAEFVFPQITPFDDPSSADLWWLDEWTNYTLYWVPSTNIQTNSAQDISSINPATQKQDLWINYNDKVVLWEGFSISGSPSDNGYSIQCQGSLYQLDRYLAKPEHRGRPVTMERLITNSFNPVKRTLRTKKLSILWPAGWSKIYEISADPDLQNEVYKPHGVKVGDKWTGFTSRNTGSWERALTGYVQDTLAQMYTTADCGVTSGNQWTVGKFPGRKPVMYVRDRLRAPDFAVWYGTPGVKVALTRDGLSSVNIIYGQGSGFDGVNWSNVRISDDGKTTSYLPIAYESNVFPYPQKSGRRRGTNFMPSETLVKFSPGVSSEDATKAAGEMLSRDSEPGWSGNITLKSDATTSIIKWKIYAGMTVLLKGFYGVPEGIRLHVAEATHSPMNGTVSLTVDTQYRDLLTLEEVMARTRDPLTPAKMLQVNRRSLVLEDMLIPWDYSAGSGAIPKESRKFIKSKPDDLDFPWDDWTEKHPPQRNPAYYIKVDANAAKSLDRWVSEPVIMSQAGKARSIQIMCVDLHGKRLKIPFHVSFYYLKRKKGMPRTSGDYSPFLENHFDLYDKQGNKFPEGQHWQPPGDFIIGWGNYDQKAGYSPNRSSDDLAEPTGLLVDESSWSWNMDGNNGKFNPFGPYRDSKKFNNADTNAKTLYIKIYAEHTEEAYFIGRIFRDEPGV